MKYRTLTPDLSADPNPAPQPSSDSNSGASSVADDLSHLSAATQRETSAPELGFELTLGPLQITSLAFVLLVVLVLCGGGAYAIGKSSSKTAVAATPVPHPDPAQPIQVAPVASIVMPAVPQVPSDHYQSLFGTPIKGQLYIQMGAVDRGMSIVFAQGLQKMGFKATIIPGPMPKVFRVLVGPFPGMPEYTSAKQILDNVGLDTFARRFDDSEPAAVPNAAPKPADPKPIAP